MRNLVEKKFERIEGILHHLSSAKKKEYREIGTNNILVDLEYVRKYIEILECFCENFCGKKMDELSGFDLTDKKQQITFMMLGHLAEFFNVREEGVQ